MRWAAGLVDPPALDRGEPAWRGQNLDGTLRIWREQPIGDELLFARLVSSAKGRARRVIFECSQRFVPLFARSFPDIEVRQQGDVSERAEAQVSLASLGKVLAADRAALGQGLPYLKADPAATAALRSRYQELAQGRLIVGISWFSNNKRIGKHKSTEPTEWGGLLSLGHFFVNLQYGKAASEAIAANERFGCGIHTDPTVDQP
jgi:hypothetical protein